VTGQHADEEAIEQMIETGESEMIFQKAILEQGRGYVMDTLAEIRERRDAGAAFGQKGVLGDVGSGRGHCDGHGVGGLGAPGCRWVWWMGGRAARHG
jgi:hypothetical protein